MKYNLIYKLTIFALCALLLLSGCINKTESTNTPNPTAVTATEPTSTPVPTAVTTTQTATHTPSPETSASGDNGNTPTKVTQSTEMNLTQIKSGNYSSIQGTWIEVAYAVNTLDGNGYQWHSGVSLSADTLSVSSDKIAFNGITMVIRGNTLTDSDGSHPLSFENSGSSLDASLADADVAIFNWDVSFYQKGVKNDIEPNNGVKIDNTKNLIKIWTGSHYTVVFAQTDTNS